jgi:hypothetical protein
MVGETMLVEVIDEKIIRLGREFLDQLRKRILIQDAFWMTMDDGKLKLWFVSQQMDTVGPIRLFEKAQKTLDRFNAANYPYSHFRLTLSRIGFLSPSDPFVNEAKTRRRVNEFADFSVYDTFFYVIAGTH